MNTTVTTTSLAPLLERFFTQRLMQQRQVSPHTISSYRDTFRLLLAFAQQQLHAQPARLTFDQLDAPLIVAFLDHCKLPLCGTRDSRDPVHLSAAIRGQIAALYSRLGSVMGEATRPTPG